jgi:hypothetical protein
MGESGERRAYERLSIPSCGLCSGFCASPIVLVVVVVLVLDW